MEYFLNNTQLCRQSVELSPIYLSAHEGEISEQLNSKLADSVTKRKIDVNEVSSRHVHWQKIKSRSSSITDAITAALEQGGITQELLHQIFVVSEELYKITKLVTDEKDGPAKNRSGKGKRAANEQLQNQNFDDNSSPDEQINRKRRKNRRGSTSPVALQCKSCGTKDTPEWRRGPDGNLSLCNACGLHFAKILKKEQQETSATTLSGKVNVSSLLN